MNKDQTKVLTVGTLGFVVALAIGIAVGRAWDDGNPMDDMPEMDAEGMQDMEGMALGGTIRLAGDGVATSGITFGTAAVRPLTRTIRSVGVVDFDETRMSYVSSKFGGWVDKLHVDFTGQTVRRGEPLLEVYSPDLVTAQEELLVAARLADGVGDRSFAAIGEGARDLVASARRRLAYWDISNEQIERLVETGEVRKTLTLEAPMAGIVMEKDVVEGQAFEPGANLYMIADLSEVWLNVEVFEADAGLIHEGMEAEITVSALPGRTLTGRVEYVYPTLEDRTRSMRARVTLANSDGRLKPGMYATVRLIARIGETLTVPASAVLHSGERALVFVDMGGGELMPHEVVVGARGGNNVEIVSGVEPGHRVVTSAQFLLDSESNLAEVMQAMMAQMNMSDMEGMDMEGMEMGGMRRGGDRPIGPMDSSMTTDTMTSDTMGGR